MNLLVMAKEPVPGRVKTRLCPPCTSGEAALLAEAALADTMAAATASGADRVIVALEGRPGLWCPPGVEVIAQVSGGLDRRLAAAWCAVGGPAIQIGMDTPQVTAADLDAAMANLESPGIGATLGPAEDGGWWLIGLRRADRAVFSGIPMSRSDTGDHQRARLDLLGLRWTTESSLRDVDDFADAVAVGEMAPHTQFAERLCAIRHTSRFTMGATGS